MSTPTLHFMCGKAGAGKSALAKVLAEDHQAILICEDVWLTRLFPSELATFDDYIKYMRRIKTVVGPLAIDLLKRQSVVLDFPANTVDSRTWFRSIFENANVSHVLHFVNTPDALCLKRIAKRNIERPEGSHEISEATFHYLSSFFQPPSQSESFNVQLYVPQSD